MIHKFKGKDFLLNLIDTPVRQLGTILSWDNLFNSSLLGTRRLCVGGITFIGCLSRCPSSSMYFVEGISSAGAQRTLQVDASQGVQAQSISVFHNAKERGLKIIPILNKVASLHCWTIVPATHTQVVD